MIAVPVCTGSILEVFCESANVGNEQDCRDFGMMEEVVVKHVSIGADQPWSKDPFWAELEATDPGVFGSDAERWKGQWITPRYHRDMPYIYNLKWDVSDGNNRHIDS